jgi:hypothetical protein
MTSLEVLSDQRLLVSPFLVGWLGDSYRNWSSLQHCVEFAVGQFDDIAHFGRDRLLLREDGETM